MEKLIPVESFSQISFDCGNYDFLENPKNNTFFVISSLLHVMDNELPIGSVPSTIISISEDSDCPICYRDSSHIVLTANPHSWSQLAYQLAHEMCHRVIPNEVTQNLRWLEESICELSSYYFLPRLSKFWCSLRISLLNAKTNEPYYPEFEKYVENDRKKAEAFDLSSLACDTPSNELKLLINDCELRAKNAYISTCLLPIFNKHPCTWHAIPLLGALGSKLSLRDSLEEWIELSPKECRIGLQKIAHIFGAEVPLS